MAAGMRLTVLAAAALVLSAVAVGQDQPAGEPPQRLGFSAGSTEFQRREDGSIIKRYYNGVRAWGLDRELEIGADEASYDSRLQETRFDGSAAFRDSARVLTADTLVYDEAGDRVLAVGQVMVTEDVRQFWADRVEYDRRAGSVVAEGNVAVQEPERSVWADRVEYEPDRRRVAATGNVIVRDDSLKALISGTSALFDDTEGIGVIAGAPVLQKEENGLSITLAAQDTIEMFRRERIARLWNGVTVESDSLRATSDLMVYNDSLEVVTMTGEPRAEHVMHDTTDDARSELRTVSTAGGDTMRIFLAGQEVSGVEILGNAWNLTVWTDTTTAVYARSVLESVAMRLALANDEITAISAEGRARSYYMRNPADDNRIFVNEATGDTLRFIYAEGRLDRLTMSGFGGSGAKGIYYEFRPAEQQDDAADTTGTAEGMTDDRTGDD